MISRLLIDVRRAQAEAGRQALQQPAPEVVTREYAADVEMLAHQAAEVEREAKDALVDWFNFESWLFTTMRDIPGELMGLRNDHGLELKSYLQAVLAYLTALHEQAELCEQKGHPLPSRTRLCHAVQKTAERYHGAFDHWEPWRSLTPDEIREAREEFARGECMTVDEILAELKGRLQSGTP